MVENFEFYDTDSVLQKPAEEQDGVNMMLIYAGAGGGILLIAIAVTLLLLLKKKKKKGEAAQKAELISSEQAMNELFGEEPLPQITPVRDARKEQIKDFALSNPEIAAQMIRSWIKAEGD